jgi:hypothetical protein
MPTYRQLATCCLLMGLMTSAHSAELDRAGLLTRLVGSTIHLKSPDEDVFEYLDPNGDIRGESSAHGKFAAHWRLLDDRTICFESADPMQSGCVSVAIRGKHIEFHRRDGVVEGPFEHIRGNPRSL